MVLKIEGTTVANTTINRDFTFTGPNTAVKNFILAIGGMTWTVSAEAFFSIF
jgi:hypothetical protein